MSDYKCSCNIFQIVCTIIIMKKVMAKNIKIANAASKFMVVFVDGF